MPPPEHRDESSHRGILPLAYQPYEALEERPHVMVDGAARRASVVTLSHWPQAPTPLVLARDLSVEIALAFVRAVNGERPTRRRDRATVDGLCAAAATAEAVTNDHFDEDGLMSVLALTDPEFALANEARLVAVADCGDFGVVRSAEAAWISFAIGPLAEQEAGEGAGTSERYSSMIERVAHLIEHPREYEPMWHEEMQLFSAGCAAIDRAEVIIEEDVADLAVVTRTGSTAKRGSSRLVGASGGLPVHAAAVHSATTSSRILAFDDDRCELYFRYEGWVRFVSRPVPLRPGLEELAAELTALEPGTTTWEANPVGAIVGRLRPAGEGVTELDPAVVADRVRSYLMTAPPAWDPFRADGPRLPTTRREPQRGSRTRSKRRGGAGRGPRRG